MELMMKNQILIIGLFTIIQYGAVFTQTPGRKPHIVFVFVDDWGYADVGFRNPAIKSSNFDMLASTGLLLDRHYVYRWCSPSRASLLTGRWPHHVHQWNVDPPTSTLGLNLNITTLPTKLKQAEYGTHIVGKMASGICNQRLHTH